MSISRLRDGDVIGALGLRRGAPTSRTFSVDQNVRAVAVGSQQDGVLVDLVLALARASGLRFQELPAVVSTARVLYCLWRSLPAKGCDVRCW